MHENDEINMYVRILKAQISRLKLNEIQVKMQLLFKVSARNVSGNIICRKYTTVNWEPG